MREYPVFIPCFHKDGAAVFIYLCVCVRVNVSPRAESTLDFFTFLRYFSVDEGFASSPHVEAAIHSLTPLPTGYNITARVFL